MASQIRNENKWKQTEKKQQNIGLDIVEFLCDRNAYMLKIIFRRPFFL